LCGSLKETPLSLSREAIIRIAAISEKKLQILIENEIII